MNISSMTGFARHCGEVIHNNFNLHWTWEIKSVNSKSLDFKVKLPPAMDDLCQPLKTIASQYFCRGNVCVSLDLQNSSENQKLKINQTLLDELIQEAIIIYKNNNGLIQQPTISELFLVKGVVELEDNRLSDTAMELLKTKLLSDFELLCQKLKTDREEEGAKIKTALDNLLAQIKTLVNKVDNISQEFPAKLKQRLEDQLKQWLEPSNQISEERLAQELVLYVTRADIKEEIDRLKAHIKTAADLLKSSEAVGRRLDFLCQELNREANTTCSKSCDIELTNLGMELKALIEQFREQVQNIE